MFSAIQSGEHRHPAKQETYAITSNEHTQRPVIGAACPTQSILGILHQVMLMFEHFGEK